MGKSANSWSRMKTFTSACVCSFSVHRSIGAMSFRREYSRLRLASRLLREVAITSDWAEPLAEAVEVRRSRNTLTAFPRKARSGRNAGGKT